jgi:PD-(D/E)XK nuclease superfamily
MQNIKAFRPSSGPALEMCSHYEPTWSTSPNAQRGTGFHKITAALLRGQVTLDQVSEEYRKPSAYALNLAQELIEVQGGVEDPVQLFDSAGEFVTETDGIDYWGHGPTPQAPLFKRTKIIDWKTGQERDYWAQVTIYGVSLVDKLYAQLLPSDRGYIELDLTVAFVDQQKHFTQTFTYAELRARVDKLIEDIRDPASPYSVNAYCGYCDLRGRCPAWDRERAVAFPAGDLHQRFDIIRRDPVQLARFIIAKRRFDKIVDQEDFDALAIEYIKNGADLPGLKIVNSPGRITNDKEALIEAIMLWEYKHGKRFPAKQGLPSEYLKMTKGGE